LGQDRASQEEEADARQEQAGADSFHRDSLKGQNQIPGIVYGKHAAIISEYVEVTAKSASAGRRGDCPVRKSNNDGASIS
jgi:hypothetical protein